MRVVSIVAGGSLALALTSVVPGCADAEENMAPRSAHSGRWTRGDAPRTTDDIEQVGCTMTPPVRRAPPEFDDADPSAVRLFFDVLAPYGSWSEDGRLGLVWSPSHDNVGDEFVPYATHGRWTHRSFETPGSSEPPIDEYVWVSELPWGWVAFHYGRWTYAGDRGWAWVPGRRYSGAWVDWRTPEGKANAGAVVGWGPTPPSLLWRILPGPSGSRAVSGRLDIRDARLEAVAYSAFATPYAYARTKDLFASDLGAHLLYGPAALAVAHNTLPGGAPRLEQLGYRNGHVPAPPSLDRGLQQAWMLATPATAGAVGAGPELPSPPHDRTYVTGGPHYAVR